MDQSNEYTDGDGVGEDSDGEESCVVERELSLYDSSAPARALAALDALRKSRQHYDVVLAAGGAEVLAHRAVLAAASPYLLEALIPPPHAAAAMPLAYRVDDVDAEALRELVSYAYSGRLRARDAAHALRLYRAAWRLRVEPARAHLADRLMRTLSPHTALDLRALPALTQEQLARLDHYIAEHFSEICECGAFATLPLLRIEMLRETSAEGGEETPAAVAEAALVWLRDHNNKDIDLEELCSRVHLLYVDCAGALRDCGELPPGRGDAPEIEEYRREAAERARAQRRAPSATPPPALAPPALPALELGARRTRTDCAVIAASRAPTATATRTTRALVTLRGRLAAARVCWRDVGGAGATRGGVLGGARADPDGSERRARLAHPRSALGAATLGARLLVCGGYDRARVLRAAELYDPATNEWSPLPDMRCARARFPAACIDDRVYVIGGSDGHNELDTVDVFTDGVWRAETRLPVALSHAGAAVDVVRGAVYVVGGWSGGASVKRVLRYECASRSWSDAPSLCAARSQCGAALWRGALWALGGCDAWRCLATTETLPLEEGGAVWALGPALPTARRSVGAAVWRGALVAAGGSDGTASLRRTEWLEGGAETWRTGPALRRARAALGLVPLEDVLYAVGGFDGKEFLACVECLYEPSGEWTTLCAPPAPPAPLTPPIPSAASTYADDEH